MVFDTNTEGQNVCMEVSVVVNLDIVFIFLCLHMSIFDIGGHSILYPCLCRTSRPFSPCRVKAIGRILLGNKKNVLKSFSRIASWHSYEVFIPNTT